MCLFTGGLIECLDLCKCLFTGWVSVWMYVCWVGGYLFTGWVSVWMSGCASCLCSHGDRRRVCAPGRHRQELAQSFQRTSSLAAKLTCCQPQPLDSPLRCQQARMLPAGAPSAFTMPDGRQVELTIIIISTDIFAIHIIIIIP